MAQIVTSSFKRIDKFVTFIDDLKKSRSMQQLEKKQYIIYFTSALLDMFYFVLSGILSDKGFVYHPWRPIKLEKQLRTRWHGLPK